MRPRRRAPKGRACEYAAAPRDSGTSPRLLHGAACAHRKAREHSGLGQVLGKGDKKHAATPARAGRKTTGSAGRRKGRRSAARHRPRDHRCPDAGVELVPATRVPAASGREALLRGASAKRSGEAKQHVDEERRRQGMQRIARETEERRASHELGRTDGGRRGSDSSVSSSTTTTMAAASRTSGAARGGARRRRLPFSSADADADDFEQQPLPRSGTQSNRKRTVCWCAARDAPKAESAAAAAGALARCPARSSRSAAERGVPARPPHATAEQLA